MSLLDESGLMERTLARADFSIRTAIMKDWAKMRTFSMYNG